MARKAKNNYIDNKLFTAKLTAFLQEKESDESITLRDHPSGDYIGLCIMEICQNLAKKSNFVNYTFKDEMISDGIENCVKAALNFKYEISSNAFGYFTQVAFNAFVRRIQLEQKQREKKLRVLSDSKALSNIIEKQFDACMPGSEHEGNIQHFVDQLQNQLVENDQLIEIIQVPKKRRNKELSETPISKLMEGN